MGSHGPVNRTVSPNKVQLEMIWDMSILYGSFDDFFIAEVWMCRAQRGGIWAECSQQARLFRQLDACVAW